MKKKKLGTAKTFFLTAMLLAYMFPFYMIVINSESVKVFL